MNTEKKPGKFQVIFRFLKGSFYLFVLSLVFSVLFTACNALTPQIIRYAVDHILTGVGDSYGRHLLFLAAGAVLVAAILSGIFNYFSKMTLAKGSENFMKNIRDTLFHHIEKLPFAWHVRHQTGEIIQRCTSDVEVIRNFVCNQMPDVFRIVFLMILYLGIMFSMNVKLSLVAAAFIPVIVGYSGFFYSKIGDRFMKADEAEGALSSTVQENLTGVRVVRAFGREKFEIDRFDERNERFAGLWIKLGGIMSARKRGRTSTRCSISRRTASSQRVCTAAGRQAEQSRSAILLLTFGDDKAFLRMQFPGMKVLREIFCKYSPKHPTWR